MGETLIRFVDYDKKLFSDSIFKFDCGDPDLNYFLVRAGRHSCTTKLIFIGEELAAFISFCCASFEHIEKDRVENIPAIEIKAYAVDKQYQKGKLFINEQTFSQYIFQSYLMFLQDIAVNYIYADYYLVFAKKTSTKFLEHQGFEYIHNDEFVAHINNFEAGCTPMFAKILHPKRKTHK